jgi:hypothetical protein
MSMIEDWEAWLEVEKRSVKPGGPDWIWETGPTGLQGWRAPRSEIVSPSRKRYYQKTRPTWKPREGEKVSSS